MPSKTRTNKAYNTLCHRQRNIVLPDIIIMKAYRIRAMFLLEVFLVITIPQICFADAFEYLTQSLAKVVAMASLLNLADYDYNSGNSLFGYYLSEGSERGLRYSFEKNRSYVILAAGDDDIVDLDLSITDENGREILSDKNQEPMAFLEFRPKYSGTYVINIKNYESYQTGFCSYVVLRNTGSGLFSLDDITEALQNALKLAQAGGIFAKQFPQDRMVLFGGRYQEDDSNSVWDIGLESGRYMFLAAGSNNINDVDITVIEQYQLNNSSGETVCRDNESNDVAFCEFRAISRERYCLTLKNYDSQGSGFVFGVLLQN